MNNLELMRKRLEYQGGVKQEDRMIKDKYRAFLHSLKYSYQACDVRLAQAHGQCLDYGQKELDHVGTAVRALINPNKVKQDYDEKILSVSNDSKLQAGDVIKWANTDSYWLIYLEELTEDAYFRSGLRRCRYQIHFLNELGEKKSTWAAIRGPVETKIESDIDAKVIVDGPNLSLILLLPLNEETTALFTRYNTFMFNNRKWQVQAVDDISIPGVIEVAAEEWWKDRQEDSSEFVGGLVVEKPLPPKSNLINGSQEILPMIAETFTCSFVGQWSTDKPDVVCIERVDDNTVEVKWTKTTSGNFTLYCNNGTDSAQQTVVVNSLF